MNITCNKNDLSNSVNIVLKAVPGKSTMPILECLVIEVKDDQVKLIANNMELGIETYVKAEVAEEGSIAINAKLFSEIIRKLPADEVMIQTDDNYQMKIVFGKSKFNLSGKMPEEFPMLPEVEKTQSVLISQFTLRQIIQQTIFSISDNEANKIMTGELIEINDNQLRIVALDGHRISIRKIMLKDTYQPVKVIIPGKTLNEISKILTGGMDDEVCMYFTDNHALFEFDGTKVVSRLIEGEYYKIDQMLSDDYDIKAKVNKKEFLDCIDRSTLLVRESEKKPIILNMENNMMELKIQSAMGSMKEDIEIEQEGPEIMIGFNPKFLMDALKVIEDEEVELYFYNPKAPCFIRDKEKSYIYLILPVNFNV